MASWKKVVVSGSAADLASLTLDTQLAVAEGGTGAVTFTDGTVLVGNGTSAIEALAVGDTNIIIGDGSGSPTVAALSGDVTMTNAGVVTIAAGAVENSMLADDAVDSDELAAGSVDNAHLAGSIAVSKTSLAAGTNITLATNTLNVDDAFLVNDASDTTTGTITAAGFTTTGTWTFDTDTATVGIVAVQTGSTFTDNDTDLMSAGAIKEKIEDYGYGVGGGDITSVVAGDGLSGGATSGAATVTLDLNELGTETTIAQDDFIAMVDATDNGSEKITLSNLEDEIFGNISGDASVAAGGALTIAATSVENSMLAGSIAVSKTSLAAGTNITLATNTLNVDDAFLVNDGSDTTTGTITAAGFTSTGTWTFDTDTATAGITTIQTGSTFVDVDTAIMSAGAIKEKIEGYSYSTTDVSVSKDNLETTLALMDTNYTIGSGTSIDGTISGDLTVTGDLTVSGATVTANVTNLNIEDKFINLNDGGSAADCGIVFEGQGASLGWDESAHRLAFDFVGATEGQTTIASDAFICSVVTASNASYQYNGNIKVESSTIYIYVE